MACRSGPLEVNGPTARVLPCSERSATALSAETAYRCTAKREQPDRKMSKARRARTCFIAIYLLPRGISPPKVRVRKVLYEASGSVLPTGLAYVLYPRAPWRPDCSLLLYPLGTLLFHL